ncbi:MAG: hypothetical protein A3F54_02170 [Candidatus Kerfeldbacteria bacterium RIFCSPHIGHO2_12_FULL_48_17]|uniref:SpoVT-AbrB domain-containing protein n=1 Tax=Candidatus Kerfeldbacteria bacterium RIFCSPHIGHO2_12_FULL_48_17 TaxID=1798542 RepID=A0A1G2AX07_9BACT|nr:MAG: hypothetical protein A3F54_02170 [Candidatus Kerfeldbacteria bacterium RIFCSPHIGHO2_12_FULL_48_17]
MNVRVTSLSSKGQVVIPNDIREKLSLTPGSNLLVLTDGSNLLLKPIKAPKMKIFTRLMKQSRKLASKNGIKQRDVNSIIKSVRNESRS